MMNRKKFVKLFGLSVMGMFIPVGLAQQNKNNPYLTEFNGLSSYYHTNGEKLIPGGEIQRGDAYMTFRRTMVDKYSWAVPNDEAIESIVEFAGKDEIVDFGAGTGYWASLIVDKGINVTAIDKWAGYTKWYDVEHGSYEYLQFSSGKVLMLVFPPQYSDMAITALKTWDGTKFIYVGEPYPSNMNGNADFFTELNKNWLLTKTVAIPNWYGHNDAVFFYKRIK